MNQLIVVVYLGKIRLVTAKLCYFRKISSAHQLTTKSSLKENNYFRCTSNRCYSDETANERREMRKRCRKVYIMVRRFDTAFCTVS